MKKDGRECHDTLVKNTKPILAFDENRDYKTWKEEIRAKFYELSGLNDVEANAEPNPQFEIVKEETAKGDARPIYIFNFFERLDESTDITPFIDALATLDRQVFVGVSNTYPLERFESDKVQVM